ncbi:hypothetical protein [Mesorhizobium sp. 2RAF21]|uniref:hypothetical protein n=1 Tax=Mesorhizobium sp. 2RAF21 TaxID=3232995 RepID=UPI003F9A72E9
MATLRIYDLKQHALALDLRHLLDLLAPRALQADWKVSTIKSSEPHHAWFEATGDGGEQLEVLAQEDTRLSGPDLAALAKNTRQVIWGEFVGSFPNTQDDMWVTIRAIDSTFYEVSSSDETVLKRIKSFFKDVRLADDLWTPQAIP